MIVLQEGFVLNSNFPRPLKTTKETELVRNAAAAHI